MTGSAATSLSQGNRQKLNMVRPLLYTRRQQQQQREYMYNDHAMRNMEQFKHGKNKIQVNDVGQSQ